MDDSGSYYTSSSNNISQNNNIKNGISQYSSYYNNLVVSLYYGKGDGEVFLVQDPDTGVRKMITCVDISTLFQEKRVSAIQMI